MVVTRLNTKTCCCLYVDIIPLRTYNSAIQTIKLTCNYFDLFIYVNCFLVLLKFNWYYFESVNCISLKVVTTMAYLLL